MAELSRLKIIIANGVNLDLLGSREPDCYGMSKLQEINAQLITMNTRLNNFFEHEVLLDFFQTNDEADFLTKISVSCDALIVNAGAWSHTSLAIGDRLKGLATHYFEVHLSNILSREEIRKKSFLADAAQGVIIGMGLDSYTTALFASHRLIK